MNQRWLVSSSGRKLALPVGSRSRIGCGGQGQVYRTSLDGRAVALKLGRGLDAGRLQALQQLSGSCDNVATLPLEVFYNPGDDSCAHPAAYAMRYVDPACSVSAARLFNFDEISRLQGFTWRDAVLAALCVAEAVATLHRHGVVIGDLNPENVLLEVQIATATQSHWRAVLLDCDSFQLEATGVRYFCPVGRPHYTAPELIGADFSRTWREPSSDAFALAVVIYQLLLHDHPYDSALIVDTPEMDVTARISRGLYPHAACPASGVLPGPFRPAPAHIDAAMDAAFRRGLMGWPSLRPTAAEWVVLLRDLYNRVVPCAIDRRHHHVADQACLWCTVERRLGRSLSTYSEAPVRASNQWASAVPTAHTANANHPLLPALQQQIMQARELVLHRASLIDVALQLQATLQQLRNRYRDPVAWLDQQAGERRLQAWRNRLSRWLGHHDKIKRRQEQVDRLTALANKTVQLAAEGVAALDAQREALLQRLAAAPTAILADRLPLVDEPQALEVLLEHAREQQRQRWLEQQLASQPIKSWNVPGFGNQRLALLERHGLTRADQVWRQPNTLSAIPGIGASLQKNLLQKLEQVSSELQDGWPSANAGDGLTLADCLEPSLLALIKDQRIQMTVLEQITNELSAACRDLRQRLEARLLERNALRQQLRGLF